MKVCPTCNRLFRSAVVVCPGDGRVLTALQEWRPGEDPTEEYRLIENIGHGSMGEAFRAEALANGEIRVLKFLASQLAEDDVVLESFERAIQATGRLRHKHVVHIESFERAKDGRPFIVMEYFPGLSLRELMLRQGPMEAYHIQQIAAQVCSALEFGHSLGILHRNLKPENISIKEKPDGTPFTKVMEFGLAAAREAAAMHDKPIADAEMTKFGPVVGLCEYISPEQAAGTPSGKMDGRADVYSLGAVMFEDLTGELPHYVENLAERLFQTVDASRDERLVSIVLKALQHDPRDRYHSAAEMAADLHKIRILPTHASVMVPIPNWDNRQEEVGWAEAPPLGPAAKGTQNSFPAATGGRAPENRRVGSIPVRGPLIDNPKAHRSSAPSDDYLDILRRSLVKTGAKQSVAKGLSRGTRWGSILVLALGLGLGGTWTAFRWYSIPPAPQVVLPDLPRVPLEALQPQPPAMQDVEPGKSFASDAATQTSGPSDVRTDLNGNPQRRKETAGPQFSGAQKSAKSRGSPVSVQPPVAAARTGAQTGQPSEVSSPQAAAQAAALKQRIAEGWVFMGRKDYRAASETFSEALKIDPSSVEAQAALRLARYALQHPNVEVFSSSTPAGSERSLKKH